MWMLDTVQGWREPMRTFFIAVLVLLGGSAAVCRLVHLDYPLVEPHAIRQTQTAITIRDFARGSTNFFKYQSALDGKLYRFIQEFPLYQGIASLFVRAGMSIEVASRLLTLFMFLLTCVLIIAIARDLWGDDIAVWAGLFYFVSPFNMSYSRVCLIDPTALAFEALSAFCLLRAIRVERAIKWISVGIVSGCLASMIKPTIWYAPTTAIFLYVVFLVLKKRLPLKKGIGLLFSVSLPLVSAIVWIRYAMWARSVNGLVLGEDTMSWIVGPLEKRFSWTAWRPILDTLFRRGLHDWMAIPFAVGLLSKLPSSWALVGTGLFSILGPFNVHIYHDYYLIAETPYFILAAAIGMHRISHLRAPVVRIFFSAICVVALFKLSKLPNLYGTVFHNFPEYVQRPKLVQKWVEPNEVVLIDEHSEAWWYVLYSDRHVIFSKSFVFGTIEPATYYLKPDGDFFFLTEKLPQYWVEGEEDEMPFLRVKENQSRKWNPEHNLKLSAETIGDQSQTIEYRESISACARGTWMSLPTAKKVEIKVGEKDLVLPAKPFIYFPPKHLWGCEFKITLSN